MTDNPDLDEAIRLLRSLCLQWPSTEKSVYWLSNDDAAKMDQLLAKYPERPKLLPCPFCGGNADSVNLGSLWIAACRQPGPSREAPCCAQTATWADEDDATAAWNRRATPASGPLSGGKPE